MTATATAPVAPAEPVITRDEAAELHYLAASLGYLAASLSADADACTRLDAVLPPDIGCLVRDALLRITAAHERLRPYAALGNAVLLSRAGEPIPF